MSTQDIEKEIAKLQVKIEHLEKQDIEIKLNVKELQKDLDNRFDEFEKKMDEREKKMDARFDNFGNSLKNIEDLITQSKGAKKAITIIVSVVAAIVASATAVYNFIKHFYP